LWVAFTDPVIPAHAGIQMLHRIAEPLSFSKEYFSSHQVPALVGEHPDHPLLLAAEELIR